MSVPFPPNPPETTARFDASDILCVAQKRGGTANDGPPPTPEVEVPMQSEDTRWMAEAIHDDGEDILIGRAEVFDTRGEAIGWANATLADQAAVSYVVIGTAVEDFDPDDPDDKWWVWGEQGDGSPSELLTIHRP